MDQRPTSPPTYTPEYGKPPPYGPETDSARNAMPMPQVPNPEPGWNPAQPPPPYHAPPVQTDQRQAERTRPTVITVTTQPAYVVTQPQQQTVLVLGNCPSCRVGFLQNEFNICGIIIAILFFPIGILCCLFMMDKRCNHCGARY